MPTITRASNNLQKERLAENTAAENERLRALLDYVAMMADVELPEEEVQHEREV